MRGSGFDLASLRRTRPNGRAQETLARIEPQRAMSASLSEPLFMPTRRDMFKMGLAASALGLPLGKAAYGFAVTVPIAVTCRRNRAAFCIDGGEVFVLDAARFAGSPRVTLTLLDGGARRIRLSGARWPGTRLSADMTLTLDDVGKLDITLALGGFSARVKAKQWLLGEKVARSKVTLSGLVCELDSRGALGVKGTALAEFTPDWRLVFIGNRIVAAAAHDEIVYSDSIEVSLPSSDEPSAFSRRIARRTHVVVTRGDESWALAPQVLAQSAGALEWMSGAVETLTFETAESASGNAYRALIADAPSGVAAQFTPAVATGLTGTVQLAGVRTVSAFDAAGDRIALIADVAAGSRVKVNGVTLHLADDASPFQAIGNARATEVISAPKVAAIGAGLEGVITSPIIVPKDSKASVSLGQRAAEFAGIVVGGGVRIPDGSTLAIMRPSDMLNISVAFWGLELVSSDVGRTIKPARGAEGVSLGYIFPPQAFNEQAIWDTTDDSDPNATLPSIPTPVKGQITGHSQLSFRFPRSMYSSGMPYTIDALLDWSELVPIISWWGRADIPSMPGQRPTDPREKSAADVPVTYLEMPYHVYITPTEYGYWKHQIDPAVNAKGDWTALWHTRLHQSLFPVNGSSTTASATGDTDATHDSAFQPPDIGVLPPIIKPPAYHLPDPVPQIRPIWSPEYEAYKTASIILDTLYPLTKYDRRDLVRLTELRQESVNAPMLMLTGLGGWMDFSGTWDVVDPDLKEWKHKATLGRDSYVRIARGGYLFPFGHKAVKIDITERKFSYAPSMPGVPTSKRKHAYLYKSTYIVVLEPTHSYSNSDKFRERSFPFAEVTIVT